LGRKEWETIFGGPGRDGCNSVQQTQDGGYILAGETETEPIGAGSFDAWLIRTDSSGNKEWEETFGGADNEGNRQVQQTEDGGYIIASMTESFGAGSADVRLIKMKEEGGSGGLPFWVWIIVGAVFIGALVYTSVSIRRAKRYRD
jgi:hypothetical protein